VPDEVVRLLSKSLGGNPAGVTELGDVVATPGAVRTLEDVDTLPLTTNGHESGVAAPALIPAGWRKTGED
jgi:hypothetical protein